MRSESADYLRTIYEAVARGLGAAEDEARIFAGSFIQADLFGKDTQGIACIPLLYPWFRSGAIRFGATPKVVKQGPSFVLIDGLTAKSGRLAPTKTPLWAGLFHCGPDTADWWHGLNPDCTVSGPTFRQSRTAHPGRRTAGLLPEKKRCLTGVPKGTVATVNQTE